MTYPWYPGASWAQPPKPQWQTSSQGHRYTTGQSFLSRFQRDGRFGVAGGMLDQARAAGFSDKQIAVALTKNRDNLLIGDKIRPGAAQHTSMATSVKNNPLRWIHNFQSPSGGVGYMDLMRGLSSGKTEDDFLAAGGMTAGGTPNWGIAGFGKDASAYLQRYLDGKANPVKADASKAGFEQALQEPEPVWKSSRNPITLTGAGRKFNSPSTGRRKKGNYFEAFNRSGGLFGRGGGRSGSSGPPTGSLNIA